MWIDVINERETPKASRCIGLLEDGAPLALTDVIFTEILKASGPSGGDFERLAACTQLEIFE